VVPWIFLAVTLVGAWFTFNAYLPRRARGALAVPSFFAGWLTAELSAHHFAWQLAATVFFVWAGALEAWPGWLGLGITLASWAGLFMLLVLAGRTQETVERALREGLGPDYRNAIAPGLAERTAEAPEPRGRLLLPFWLSDPAVEMVRDVRYAPGAGRHHLLDVYRPRAGARGAPVLLQIHGGAWMIGDKREQGLPLMLHLAARGWVCVTANYRLSPRATFPEHLVDVKLAIHWVREHVAEYGGDPDFVAITGGSAGGHLAALAALTANDAEYQPGFESADTSVQGCVPIYGVYDFVDAERLWPNTGLEGFLARHVMKATREEAPEAYAKASPVARVSPDAPPFMVVHGDADTLVPVEQARLFAERLRAVSRSSVVYLEVPGAQHAFELFPSLRSQLVRKGIERFLATLRFQRAASRRASAA